MPRTIKADDQIKSAAHLSVKMLLRFQMDRRRLNYAALTKLLNRAGVEENERNLANKVAKGELPAWLFLLCMKVMGAETITLAEWPLTEDELKKSINWDETAPVPDQANVLQSLEEIAIKGNAKETLRKLEEITKEMAKPKRKKPGTQ
jgi:hypothetical protein